MNVPVLPTPALNNYNDITHDKSYRLQNGAERLGKQRPQKIFESAMHETEPHVFVLQIFRVHIRYMINT